MSSPRRVALACAQMSGCGGTTEARLEEIDRLAAEASERGARLLVTPEMSATGYELRHEMMAEPLDGRIGRALEASARAHDIFLVVGTTERRGPHRYNVLVLVGPDGLVGRYRKLHVSAVENAFWRVGDGPTVLECDLGRIGFGICADMLFPTPWRAYPGRVDLLVIGAAWPDHAHTVPFPYGPAFTVPHVRATTEVPVHLSRVLGVPVVLANAAGSFEARLPPFGTELRGRFAGRSCIVDGDRVERADLDEKLLVTEARVGEGAREGSLEPWIPSWSRRFRVAAQAGDVALGLVYRAFYRAGASG